MEALKHVDDLDHQRQEDLFDWQGCEAVQFDPEKLGGRATVGNSRMGADGVFLNYEDGMSPEEISDAFGTDLDAIRTILAFAKARDLKATA